MHALIVFVGELATSKCLQYEAHVNEQERSQAIIDGICAPKPEGAAYARDLANGYEVVVFPALFGAARLCKARKGDVSSETVYDYPRLSHALQAAVEWDGTGDPLDGWNRHWPSGRRRPDGTRESEKYEP